MAKVCEICGKGRQVIMKVSHAHNRSKKVSNANVQKVRALVNGKPMRIRVCTRCIKSGFVTKPI